MLISYCNLSLHVPDIYLECTWESFLGNGNDGELDFLLMPFSHPAFILYSSGTVSFGSHT